MSVDAICALFGKTSLLPETRLSVSGGCGRKHNSGSDSRTEKGYGQDGGHKLFDILDKYHLKVHRRKRTVRTTWSESWLHKFPNLVTDAYSKKIMGWCLSPSLHADATISALQMAIRNAGCDLKGLIHHSDRGCQYCCEKYVKLLQDNGIEISMTQDGDPRDNAIAERVNGILKTDWLYDDHFIGFEDAYRRVAEVINLYNNKRPHLSLNYKTPAEAHLETGELKRVWKNYYKGNKPEEVAKVISDLTSGCRISAAY